MKLLVCLFFVFLLSFPAKADVIFRHGSKKDKHQLQSVYKYLPYGKDKTVIVALEDNRDWYFPKAVGVYWEGVDRIQLRMPEGKDPLVFAHEYGHHVYYTVLTKEQREDWKKFWEKNKEGMPSDYGIEDEAEGFAEVYTIEYYKGKFWEEYHPASPEVVSKFHSYFNKETR